MIAWGIYRRVRRNIGRQKLQPRRIIFSIVIFSLVSVLFIGMSLQQMHLMLGIVSGLALGVGLGFIGLRLTKFETNDEGHFYTPNTHIGVALSLLFVGRLLYRFWVLRDVTVSSGHPPPFQSPLTFFIFGLIAGYYIVYFIGLFVHTHDKK
ncbi:MAG: hypothetical protein WDN00_16710 [Limisphaerales bacterium]